MRVSTPLAVVLAVVLMVGTALATAIAPPTHIDYTLMGGSTSVNSPSYLYDYQNTAVICDTILVAQGVLVDTLTTSGVFYDPVIWPLTKTHALQIRLPKALNSTTLQEWVEPDSYGVQLPGKWSKFVLSKPTADTGAVTPYCIVGRVAAPMPQTKLR